MKKVELKEIPLDDKSKLVYLTEMITCLRAPAGEGGTDLEEMATVIPIIQKLKAAGGETSILLEDAEHAVIAERIKNQKFALNHEALYEMLTDITEADSVADLKEVAEG